jgi:hypothetical protein
MTIELIGIIALALGFASLYRSPSFIVNVFLCSTLLGAAAASVLEALGGTSLPPAHLLLGFLTLRLLRDKAISKNIANGFTFGRPGFWLLLTTIYCTATAYIMPRLFAGQTVVVPVRAESAYTIPLGPAMTNLTQSIYFIGDFVCFAVIYGYASSLAARKSFGAVAVRFAALNLIFAAIDLGTYFTGTTEMLSFIRNGTYGLLNDTEVAGFKRIVGSFTEAASFAGMTLGCLAFTSRLWLLGIRPRFTGILTFLAFFALLFSTSTTAYVGLAVFFAVTYFDKWLSLFSPFRLLEQLSPSRSPSAIPIRFIWVVCSIPFCSTRCRPTRESSARFGIDWRYRISSTHTDLGREMGACGRRAFQLPLSPISGL